MTRLRDQPRPAPLPGGSDIPAGRYPADRRVVSEGPDGRCQIDEPRSGRRWAMGRDALFAASQFDGRRSYHDIAGLVRGRCGRAPTLDGLIAFEYQSLKLGLLEPTAAIGSRPGARAARLARAMLRPTIIVYQPATLIDRLWPYLRWLTAPAAVGGVLLLVTALGAVILSRAAIFSNEITALVPHAGLIVLYCFAFVSAAFHEGAHALACRRYGVPVSFVAFGLLCLLPVAWTVPDQRTWSSLRLRQRLVTTAAGPLGSLLFAGIGALLWLAGHQVEVFRVTGLLALSTGPVVMLPTLIPTFPGDAYLVLTELTGRPGLRQSSLRYLAAAGVPSQPGPAASAGDKTWYLSFGIATIASWAGGLALLGWLIWHARHLAIV